ncbi:MAG: hypothetical protein MOGMAGMI_00004 [Candidatus Omnitrophica bacterium]|nr:hypothetical protein [Candidatus Omnitrophota bacterium]
MNKLLTVFKTLFVATLAFAGLAVPMAYYGYGQIQEQEKRLTAKDAEIGALRKNEEELQAKVAEAERRAASSEAELARLREETARFSSEKEAILSQVRNSVSSFETFRRESTEEIGKLKRELSMLEKEKTGLIEKLRTVETLSKEERERFTADIQVLSRKIESHKKMEARLVENLKGKDTASVIKETAKLHYNMGNFYFRNGEYARAAEEYRKSVHYQPDEPDTNFNLALVADEFLEDRPTALKYFKRYLELRPEAPDYEKVEQRILDLELRDKVYAEDRKKQKQADPQFQDPLGGVAGLNFRGDRK